ncbi:hypothetical protein MATR_20990 [Marivirga tractuosa]|uniref:Uncharacterized protein n=1 Tax=Marivirga tractuosa (strain ATCC 23168 / DSM 4126 / NBRC 15989 / NCIMB 1408 / VKM B-1430 / H-43) TaxID=643867 RepID=E4TLZ3_MARTH|nr:hypothetical protein Ftrac_0275 [Marivirga tractuosa DSM 4126]BDD15274.1 hypothetical protein MATR_20990 [Marivirga tractuosa]
MLFTQLIKNVLKTRVIIKIYLDKMTRKLLLYSNKELRSG